MVRDDNRGRRPERRISDEERRIRRKRIEERNKNIKRESTNRISANNSRRRVDSYSEEDLEREFNSRRKAYEENIDYKNEEEWDRTFRNNDDDEYEESYYEEESIRKNAPRKKSTPKKKNKSNKRKKTKKRRFGIGKLLKILAVLLIFVIGFTMFKIFNTIGKISNDDMIKAKPVAMDSTVNILLLGLDIGSIYNPNDNDAKRTDTIMVLNFNPKTKKVNLVSIPRDTKITIKGRSWKLNAAYPVGGEEEIVKQVEGILGVDINYLAKINYQAFRDVIDAIGGVDVEIKHDMDYTDSGQGLRIQFKKGTVEHLDGKKAEEFFRWRMNNDGTGLAMGDLGRIENQHEFLRAVVKKCTSPTMIFKMPKILQAVEKNVMTNMDGMTMLKYALKLISVKPDNFVMSTLKGTPKTIGGQSYFIFEKEKNKALLEELKSGTTEPIKENNKEDKKDDKSILKGDIKVMILNSTNVSGLAGRYKSTIDREGFKKIDVGTIENNPSKTTYAIVKSKAVEEIAKKELVGIDSYEEMKENYQYSNYDLVIVLGLDAS